MDRPDQDFLLVRTKYNTRERSQESSRKDDGDELDVFQASRGFQKEAGEYGFTWAKLEKGDEDGLPSINEIMRGLKKYYMQ